MSQQAEQLVVRGMSEESSVPTPEQFHNQTRRQPFVATQSVQITLVDWLAKTQVILETHMQPAMSELKTQKGLGRLLVRWTTMGQFRYHTRQEV
jgi:hypothetical protein